MNSYHIGTRIGFALSKGLSAICLGALATALGFAAQFQVQAQVPDTTRPTLIIASPLQGARLLSPLLTFRGRAQDNQALDEVYCQVNDGSWELASGTAYWMAETELLPGVNTLKAYALDAAGNASRTSVVKVTYARLAPLALQFDGQGIVRSNYNGKQLELGRSYSVSAEGRNGFVFTHWSSNMGDQSTNATLRFVMRENLVLTAHFSDRARPTLRIVSPGREQRVSPEDGKWLIRGTASDNSAIEDVRIRLNDGDWVTLEGGRVWQWETQLQPGRNTIYAYAIDAAGNRSFTRAASVYYIAKSTLTLLKDGPGTIFTSFRTNYLEVGKTYTVTAQAGSGMIFAGWHTASGNLLSSSPAYTFVMTPALVLQAKFVPNPFLANAGSYYGLFFPDNGLGEMGTWASHENSGGISFNLDTDGTVQGTLVSEGKTLGFKTRLSVDGTAEFQVPRTGAPALTVTLMQSENPHQIAGSVSNGDQWSSTMLARRRPTSGTALAGKYSFMIVGCDTGSCFIGPPVPFGDSIGTVTVKPNGALDVSGTLSDGQTFSQSTFISEDGYWPVLFTPYGGRGIVIGWLSLTSFLDANTVIWEKPPTPGAQFYPDGFTSPRVAVVTPYQPPVLGQNALGWTNGYVAINSGNLPALMVLSNEVRVVNNNVQVLSGDITNLTLTITPGSGTFQGSFSDPVTGEPTPFKGILMQTSSEFFHTPSGGWFLGTNASGTIRIRPGSAPSSGSTISYGAGSAQVLPGGPLIANPVVPRRPTLPGLP